MCTLPTRAGTLGPAVIDLCSQVGLVFDPWQAFVLREALGIAPDGNWSAFEVGLLVPRQNGKGSILEGRAIGGLFVLGERLILHSAHEFKTAKEQFLRILAIVTNYDILRKRVKRITNSHGEEGIELLNGNRLRFVARTGGSGRGFSGDCVILDESYNLSAENMASLLPTLSARPNPQLWYASSAPLETSLMLSALRARGVVGSEGLAFFEWSAPEDADPLDTEMWRLSNPALGIRISEQFIRREQEALPPDIFARERLGIAADQLKPTVIDLVQWGKLADRKSQIIGNTVFSIDVQPGGANTAIGAAGKRADGDRHVEVIEHRPGTGWVLARAAELNVKWKPPVWVIDPASPAGALIQPLRDAGLTVEEVSTQQLAQACTGIVEAVTNETIRHRDQVDVSVAISEAAKRPIGDGLWAWDRRRADGNIAPLVAVTLANFGFGKFGAGKKRSYAAAAYG